ncbi:molybdenum cofactor guanylyltransferase [Paenibacillus beijingensis]|uniref:MobA-like NTP transferase domain-containing protein n=1 Tax=Paenibacillus beijingensis TaxID=1126833 RepID=A0A0D5NJ42_9BACL|nr:molybdenum cofactor guanylyltransferase [Paenibacillus beijingensis]AJY75394.1 hypothetical protein VN24_13485 [Paenibacillus beijingensis]
MMTGLILAGGPSKRMNGKRKALLPFGGEILLQRQIRELRKSCAEIIVAAEDPKPYLRLVDTDVRIITDYYHGKGPLGGMHAGLSLARHDSVWVVGCGMPFISARAAVLLDQLRTCGAEAAIPLIEGREYPLHGVYGKSCARQALALMERGERHVSALMPALRWIKADETFLLEAGIDPLFTMNIVTDEQYEHALQFAEKLAMM